MNEKQVRKLECANKENDKTKHIKSITEIENIIKLNVMYFTR